jgi:hypothetical protein
MGKTSLDIIVALGNFVNGYNLTNILKKYGHNIVKSQFSMNNNISHVHEYTMCVGSGFSVLFFKAFLTLKK